MLGLKVKHIDPTLNIQETYNLQNSWWGPEYIGTKPVLHNTLNFPQQQGTDLVLIQQHLQKTGDVQYLTQFI